MRGSLGILGSAGCHICSPFTHLRFRSMAISAATVTSLAVVRNYLAFILWSTSVSHTLRRACRISGVVGTSVLAHGCATIFIFPLEGAVTGSSILIEIYCSRCCSAAYGMARIGLLLSGARYMELVWLWKGSLGLAAPNSHLFGGGRFVRCCCFNLSASRGSSSGRTRFQPRSVFLQLSCIEATYTRLCRS